MPHGQEMQFSTGLQNCASNNFNWMLSLLPSESIIKWNYYGLQVHFQCRPLTGGKRKHLSIGGQHQRLLFVSFTCLPSCLLSLPPPWV